MASTRRLAAILAADVAGYSRLMGVDEEGRLERLKALRRELIDPKIAAQHRRIVKTTGGRLLVEFASVVCSSSDQSPSRIPRKVPFPNRLGCDWTAMALNAGRWHRQARDGF